MAEGSAQAVQAYMQLNGVVWKLLEDGTLVPLGPDEAMDPNVPVLNPPESDGSLNGQSSSGSQSTLASFFTNVLRDAPEVTPDSGHDTRGITDAVDTDRTLKQGPPPDLLPNNATIGIDILDGGDGYINRFEHTAVDLVGTTFNIMDEVVVDVVVVDSQGNTLTFQATVVDDRFEITGADLTSLAEGPIVAIATYADPYGNRVSGADNSIIDTLAEGVTVAADTASDTDDTIINAIEAADNTLSGSFTNVQEGAQVTVTVSDGVNPDLTFQATLDAAGNWSVPNVDLSGLEDGELTLSANTVDQAGNPASIADTVQKDALAEITALYDDPQQPEGIAGYLNALEGQSASFGGTVNGIEDGQAVAITITDINSDTLTFNATVTGGAWQVSGADLSSLAEGDIVLTVVAEDVAGNEATASDTIFYDPVAQLVADIAADAGPVINAAETPAVDFSGSVFDVQSGRDVQVTIADSAGNSVDGVATIAANGTWLLADVNLSSLADGNLTLTATTTDEAGNPATQTATFSKDTQAQITAEFVDEQVPDGVGGYYNATEFPTVALQGTAPKVEDGQTVTLTVTDEGGNEVTVPGVTVSGELWSVSDVDLSSLQLGELTLTASVIDQAGNSATATDTFIYDPVASINNDLSGAALDDGVLNEAEITAGVSVSGTVTGIEGARELGVEIRDQSGNSVTATATVSGDQSLDGINDWALNDLDLSSLADGELTMTVTGTDIAGNLATQTFTFDKDTQATITARFEDAVIFEGNTGLLNAAEDDATVLSGTVVNVEVGDDVLLTVSDGQGGSLTFTTQVLVDGSWSTTADLGGLAPGTLTLTAETVDLAGNPASATATIIHDPNATLTITSLDQGDVINGQEINAVVINGTVDDVEPGRTVQVEITDGNNTVTTTAVVQGDGSWSADPVALGIMEDGPLTINASVFDNAGNEASASYDASKDTFAGITVKFEDDVINDGYLGYLNATEDNPATVTGTVTDVEDGQTVSITITDSIGGQVTDTATVTAGQWSVSGLDLEGLAEGALTVTATVADQAGNMANASNGILHDTLADIDDSVTVNAGVVINAAEASSVSLSGSTTDIDASRPLQVTVEDGSGGSLTFDTTVAADGSWTLSNLDLSSLDDGTLTVTMNSDDRAGNEAMATATVDKDTEAAITVEFLDDADPTLGPNGAVIYNADGVSAVDLQGTVTGVEDGQAVTIVLTDSVGNQVTAPDAVISGGQWSAADIDLSGFVDGVVTVAVSTVDLAGNPATASANAGIDLNVHIDIDTGPDGLPLNQFLLGNVDTLSGTTDAEDGQTVTVTLSDGSVTLTFTGQVAGGAWTTPVDTTGLSNLSAWTLNAQVEDLAGNVAADATPTLVPPQAITLSENDLADLGVSSGESQIRIQNADDIRFSDTQDGLSALTSENQAVTVTVGADGLSLTVTRNGDGATVLTATLSSDGSLADVSLLAPVDQAANLNRTVFQIEVLATQNDADGTSETLDAGIFVLLQDSVPATNDDIGRVTEDYWGSGNVLDNDVALESPFTVTSINVAGTEYAVEFGSPAVVNTVYGTLTVKQDGTWRLDAARDLDHQQPQILNFSYTARDADGDSSSADVEITVIDGAAGVVSNDNGAVTEATINSLNQPSTVVTIQAGSDNLDPDSARFLNSAGQQEDQLEQLGLSSLGEPLTYTVAADGSSVTAYAGGVIVFVATIDAVAQTNGDLEATLQLDLRRPLDHLQNDALNLPFVIVATDSDGTDTNAGVFQVELNDGADPALGNATDVALDEASLAGGATVSAQGSVDVTVGSDAITVLGFAATGKQPVLTSGGETIQYQLSADGQTLTGYTSDPANPVFVVTLLATPAAEADSNIAYNVELFQALDQQTSNGDRQDPLTIPVRLQVRDSDNDTDDLALAITVTDSGDPAEVIVDTLDVSETPRKPGESLTASDTVQVAITAAQDPVVEARFALDTGAPVQTSAGVTVTQNGVALQWVRVNGQTLEATANGQTVLRLTLPDSVNIDPETTQNIDLTLDILGPVDHIDSDVLSLLVPVRVLDSDGSRVQTDAQINISDGRDPVVLPTNGGPVDEDGLENGTVPESTGSINLVRGSDAIVETSVSMLSTLTSGGLAVTLAAAADADGWWIASTSERDVFQIRVNADGTTTLQLLGPLDHPEGDNTRDPIDVAFEVLVTDADGDVSNSAPLAFQIADDMPIDSTRERTITEGDDITGNLLSDPNIAGADGGLLAQVTYKGTVYVFSGDDPLSINLLDGNGVSYGVMTLYNTGVFEVDTADIFNLGEFDTDTMQAVVEDGDGDTALYDLILNVRDADGTVVVQPVEGNEDTSLVIDLVANPGDLDQGDTITRINFNQVSLQGGSLYLDGVALATDANGNPFLTSTDMIRSPDGTVVPDGVLTFVPALNTSLQTVNPELQMQVVVSLNTGATRDFADTAAITVHSVADAPLWDAPASELTIHEDDPATAINVSASLYDDDGSETLSYRIDSIDNNLILELNGNLIDAGATLSAADFANLTVRAEDGVAGNLSFDVTAISTEQENGDTAETAHTVNVAIVPVADVPTIRPTGTLNEFEDAQIDVARLVEGSLTDLDGSESLDLILDVPNGWSVIGQNGAQVDNPASGRYQASWEDVQAGNVLLIPKEDISSVSVPGGIFQVGLTLQATETAQDGLDPDPETALSDTVTVDIKLTGVVDDPAFTADDAGVWSWNGDVASSEITGTLDEDGLAPLSFLLGSSDDDGSEQSDLVLSNLNPNIELVDANGDPVALPVVGQDSNGLIYQIKAEDLANIFIRPQPDFSGETPAFSIQQVITEPDGDSATFNHNVVLDNLPVVDTPDGETITSNGVEDTLVTLNLQPVLLDADGSEVLTGMVILDVPSGSLLLDGQVINVPSGGLDLGQLAMDEGITLDAFINSGRLTWQPPEDASGTFSFPITYQVTDTSETGLRDIVPNFSGSLEVNVTAQVDVDDVDLPDLTRLDVPDTVLSSPGNSLDLTGQVQFVEDDIDGSETLDYIVITMPAADGWFVEHPAGAIHDGNGNWLIPATGLTSNASVDNIDLLAGVTIYSETATGVENILIQGRVQDGADDAEMVSAVLQVEFASGATGTAQAVDPIQDSIIDGLEGQTVDSSGHLNTAAAGDANDQVSFRVDASDLPPGASLTGTGMQVLHASDGKTVIEYVFTQAALADLAVVGIDEDIAGALSIPVTAISTDPSGDTVSEEQTLDIELAPVVDAPGSASALSGLEDIATALNVDLDSLLNDRSTDGEQGLESIQSVRLLELPQGSFVDPEGLLSDNGDGTYTLSDPSRISDIYFLPPQHLSGTFTVNFEMTILDEVTGTTLTVVSNTDTATVTGGIEIEVEPITDPGEVIAADVTGAEDGDISLGSLQANLVDQDGSETLTVVIKGVPTDAVILIDNGGTLVAAANNGEDGGSFYGEPTYQWSLSQADLANAVIRPAPNFSGDIPLTLQALTIETGTDDVRTASQDFTVFVNPVGDGIEYNGADLVLEAQEGDTVAIDVFAKTLEPDYAIDGHPRDGNEGMVVTVQVANSSDPSAMEGLQGIFANGKEAEFKLVNGIWVAVLVLGADDLSAGELGSFNLLTGDSAFGQLDLNIRIASLDEATVDGESVQALSAPQLQQVTVNIAPQPSPPEVDPEFDHLYGEAGSGDIPLNIDFAAVNPAPGESAILIVEGLPDGMQLSAGTQTNGRWEVAEADVPGLSIVNPASTGDFSLTVYGQSELDGQTVQGNPQGIDVSLHGGGDTTLVGTAQADWIAGGSGNDTLTGGSGADNFVFRQSDLASAASDETDTLTDFSMTDGDRLDLSDLLSGTASGSGAELDAVIDVVENGSEVVFTITPTGSAVSQVVTLENTSLDTLYGGDASGVSEADFLQRLLDEQVLVS